MHKIFDTNSLNKFRIKLKESTLMYLPFKNAFLGVYFFIYLNVFF